MDRRSFILRGIAASAGAIAVGPHVLHALVEDNPGILESEYKQLRKKMTPAILSKFTTMGATKVIPATADQGAQLAVEVHFDSDSFMAWVWEECPRIKQYMEKQNAA